VSRNNSAGQVFFPSKQHTVVNPSYSPPPPYTVVEAKIYSPASTTAMAEETTTSYHYQPARDASCSPAPPYGVCHNNLWYLLFSVYMYFISLIFPVLGRGVCSLRGHLDLKKWLTKHKLYILVIQPQRLCIWQYNIHRDIFIDHANFIKSPILVTYCIIRSFSKTKNFSELSLLSEYHTAHQTGCM